MKSKDVLNKISSFKEEASLEDRGVVSSLADGVVWIKGLRGAMYAEVLTIKGVKALALNLEKNKIGAIVLGDYQQIKVGDRVEATGSLFEIGVSDDILGRVIDPLGSPRDGKADYKVDQKMPVEHMAPGIIKRKPVTTPLQTGIKAIDSMIPIGRGQRELIIGDRGTGKTAITVDTMINQKDSDVINVYVAIGQKGSKVAQLVEKLESYGVMEKTVVVASLASDPATSQYLAPYVGTAIAEYFMAKGGHALVIYDDLTKHAWAYREMSLLLRRPSGREAYPGDVFYLHSRLLERACQLSDKLGGGSLTALPVIETQAGDVSSYIPTNVISITDGQIYLEPDLFFAGVRPALNVGLSVSRIGGAAQTKGVKKVSGRLRLDLSQYYELATFAQFATDLDQKTKEKIERGKRIIELLKQPQYSPYSVAEEIVVLYAAIEGYLDKLAVERVSEFEQELLSTIKGKEKKLFEKIEKEKVLDEKAESALKNVLANIVKRYV